MAFDIESQKMLLQLASNPENLDKLENFIRRARSDEYSGFIDVLYQDINTAIIELEHKKDKFYCLDEDTITGEICSHLAHIGYNATEQTKQVGAVDLTVKKGELKWIAEAKIAYSNDKIFEGLLQLLTRYVTRDKHAGLLIYTKSGVPSRKINNWKTYISDKKLWSKYSTKKSPELQDEINLTLDNTKITSNTHLAFDSQHEVRQGHNISVRNFGVDLCFRPADSSGDKAKSIRKNNAEIDLIEYYFNNIADNTDKANLKDLIPILERKFRDIDPDDAINLDSSTPVEVANDDSVSTE